MKPDTRKAAIDKACMQITSVFAQDAELLAQNGGLPASFKVADGSRTMRNSRVPVRCGQSAPASQAPR